VLAEERPVHQALIGEIPRVGMLFVDITDAGEEAPALDGEATSQAHGLEPCLFYLHFLLGERQAGVTAEIRIDVAREHQLAVVEAEAPGAAVVVAAGHEAGDVALLEILLIRVPSLQDQRDARIESVVLRGGVRRERANQRGKQNAMHRLLPWKMAQRAERRRARRTTSERSRGTLRKKGRRRGGEQEGGVEGCRRSVAAARRRGIR
jgi:hypothetical protein